MVSPFESPGTLRLFEGSSLLLAQNFLGNLLAPICILCGTIRITYADPTAYKNINGL